MFLQINKMKKRLFALLSLLTISLVSCSLSSPSSSIEERHIDPTVLDDTMDKLNEYSIYLTDTVSTRGGKVLVIPVWFTDSSNYISNKDKILSDIDSAFFGTNEETGWRSVKGYYEEEGLGMFQLNGTVTNWYEAKVHSGTINDSNKTIALLKNAVQNFKNSVTIDEFESYDSDHNGFIDCVSLIYGVAHNTSSLGNENLWAYTYWVQEENLTDTPIANTFMWASYDFMYQDNRHCKIDAHTYIHEFGHALGFEDYYDYNTKSGYQAAGYFSMQDYNIGMHDPYSLLQLNWTKTYIPNESMTISIKPFSQTREVILLANHKVSSPYDEYMLLELYTPTGLNEFDTRYDYDRSSYVGPNTPGIRLWHVDSRLISPARIIGGEPQYLEKDIVTKIDPNTRYGYTLLESNTSYSSDTSKELADYLPKLSGKYYKYKLLELIKANDKNRDHKNAQLSARDLFTTNTTFTQSDYAKFFVNGEYMNNDLGGSSPLGWEFHINYANNESASITLTKK